MSFHYHHMSPRQLVRITNLNMQIHHLDRSSKLLVMQGDFLVTRAIVHDTYACRAQIDA